MPLPVCEICEEPLGEKSVPWQRVDERYPSGAVVKVTWVHPGCLPKDQDDAA